MCRFYFCVFVLLENELFWHWTFYWALLLLFKYDLVRPAFCPPCPKTGRHFVRPCNFDRHFVHRHFVHRHFVRAPSEQFLVSLMQNEKLWNNRIICYIGIIISVYWRKNVQTKKAFAGDFQQFISIAAKYLNQTEISF